MQENGERVVPDHRTQSCHGAVEDVVEVERGREALGHTLEGEEQRVGLGEPAHAVEGGLLLAVGVTGRVVGESARERHEGEECSPQHAVLDTGGGSHLEGVLGGDRGDDDDADDGAVRSTAGEAGEHAGGHDEQDER